MPVTEALPTEAAVPEWGPKMAALNDRQRAFVVALYSEEAPATGSGRLLYAARTAGYGNAEGTSSDNVLSVQATRLSHDAKVQAAMAEYSRLCVRVISADVIQAVRELVKDPKARDRARAMALVLDRTDPIEQIHNVKIEDNRPPSLEATKEVLERIEQLMARAGLLPEPKIIDGECKVVPS